jgi:phosphonate transport system substrate-binding protein
VSLDAWKQGQTSAQVLALYKPLGKWLSQYTHHHIEWVGYQGYAGSIPALRSNAWAASYTKLFVYLHVKAHNPQLSVLGSIVTPGANGTPETVYASAFVVPNQKGAISGLSGLHGQTVGFVSRYSASGYLLPMARLEELGLHKGRDFQVRFYGSDLKLVHALVSHQVQIGALWKGFLRIVPASMRHKVRVIETLSNIPNPLFVATGKLSAAQKAQLQAAFVHAPSRVFKGLLYQGVSVLPTRVYHTSRLQKALRYFSVRKPIKQGKT